MARSRRCVVIHADGAFHEETLPPPSPFVAFLAAATAASNAGLAAAADLAVREPRRIPLIREVMAAVAPFHPNGSTKHGVALWRALHAADRRAARDLGMAMLARDHVHADGTMAFVGLAVAGGFPERRAAGLRVALQNGGGAEDWFASPSFDPAVVRAWCAATGLAPSALAGTRLFPDGSLHALASLSTAV